MADILGNLKQRTGNIAGKIKGNIPDAAPDAASVNSKKPKMKQLVVEKAKMYEFIGMEVFDLQSAGKINIEEIEPFCKKIGELNAEIAVLEAEAALKATIICECGKVVLGGAKFCSACGKSRDIPIPQSQTENVAECVCGAVLEADALMCMECGRRVIAN